MAPFFLALCALSGIVHEIAKWGYVWQTREGVWRRVKSSEPVSHYLKFWMVTDDMPAANWLRCAGAAAWAFLASFIGLIVALIFR